MGFEQQYASSEEKWFSFYISELIDSGFLLEANYQPKSITLLEDVHVHAYHTHKNHNELVQVKLLSGMVYTMDWELLWSEKAHGIFTWREGGVYHKGFYPYRKGHQFIPFYSVDRVSLVDIKGQVIGRSNTSAITFPIKQKALMRDGVFIQKVVMTLDAKGLFARTFTPRQVVIDEVYKVNTKKNVVGDSKLKFQPILLEQWLRLRGGK